MGERLREERGRLKLNQSDFAALAGVTKKTQMLYESDERSPKADYLAAIDKAGVDILYVLTGKGKKASSSSPVDAERMAEIASLLERVAAEAGKRWPASQLLKVSVEVYNFFLDEELEQEKVERVVKLVVNR